MTAVGVGGGTGHDVGADRVGRSHRPASARPRRRPAPAPGGGPRPAAATMSVERDQPGGGDHAGLAHAAAQALTLDTGRGDDIGRSGEQRTDRRAEPLGQAAHHGGGAGRQGGGRDAGGHLGVQEAGTVEVDGQAAPRPAAASSSRASSGGARRPACGCSRRRRSADRGLVVGGRVDRPTAPRRRSRWPPSSSSGVELDAGVPAGRRRPRRRRRAGGRRRRPASPGRVSSRRASWLAMVPDGTNTAASLPTRSAKRLLEGVDRRVLAVDVVADLGVGHGPAHLRRRPGDGVGAEVDHRPRLRLDTRVVDGLLAVAVEAARGAGVLLLEGRGSARRIETKSSATDMVSEMDRAAEALIREVISAAPPRRCRARRGRRRDRRRHRRAVDRRSPRRDDQLPVRLPRLVRVGGRRGRRQRVRGCRVRSHPR